MGVGKQRNSPLINSAYRQPCFFGRGINFSVALCSNPTVWLLARTSHSSTAAAAAPSVGSFGRPGPTVEDPADSVGVAAAAAAAAVG